MSGLQKIRCRKDAEVANRPAASAAEAGCGKIQVSYQGIASAIPQVLFCIRLSLQRYRKFCFVSGYRFSDTASSSESDAPLGAVHRFSRNPMERSIEVPAPEGRPNLAQCFSVGKSERNEPSPGGTTQFSRTLLRAPIPTEQTFFITPKL